MIVVAILLTIVASTASSVGKAMQKEATKNLPKFSIENDKIFQQYRQCSTWVSGVALDVAGGIVQTVAFAMAPVSILQPISGIGLVGLSLYSHFYLHDNLSMEEWVAVGVAGVGTLGLGMSSGTSQEQGGEARPGFLRMVGVLGLVGYIVLHRMSQIRDEYTKGQKGLSKISAAMYGLQAGGCFGLSAVTIRTGFLMAAGRRWTWAPFGMMCGIGLSSYGFVLQTCGLKEGSAVIVCTCVAVISMVIGVLVGIVGLAESLPSSSGAIIVRVWSWICILYGIIVLSGGTKLLKEMAAHLVQLVPAHVWHKVPDHIAVKIKNWVVAVQLDQNLGSPNNFSSTLSHQKSID